MLSVAHQPNTTDIEPQAEATLLLVDDDDHVRRALKRVLKRARCVMLEAPDAAEGLRLLEAQPVQVVVSDYRMPGMSGVEFLRQVKERWPRVQKVLLTGQADTAAIEEAVNQAEIFRFIWKPWDDAHLILTIQSAIDQYWLVEENGKLSALLQHRNAELEALNRELNAKVEQRSRALMRAADEWRASFDAMSDPLAIVRPEGEVIRANSAFARLAGVAVNRLPGLQPEAGGFGALPMPPARVGGAVAELTRGEFTWLVRTFPFPEGGAVVVWKDVTEEREVTRRLLQAEKMAAVGQLAGGVAHEINNPLGGILAFAQLMSREERTREDLESLGMIIDAATRAKRIVESLLRFSRRPKQDERGEIDLSKVAEDALFLVQSQLKSGRVEVVRKLEPAPCVGNANQLGQILVNLLVNGLQAMKHDGRIEVASWTGLQAATVRVTDSGPGVPEEIAGRIFEPFFTTKPEGQGTGLGLSICYRIAEEHGGTIRHERAPGGGASFVLEIPLPSNRS